MPKKFKDINSRYKDGKIDLKGKVKRAPAPISREENVLYKRRTPIHPVRDLKGAKDQSYLYIKRQAKYPPKSFGNLLKIGLIGFLIIVVVNAINVYFVGIGIEKEISLAAYDGYSLLLDAGKDATQIQFDKALEAFDSSTENFKKAEEKMWFINTDHTFYAKSSDVEYAVNALLEGGKYFAAAGKHFLEAIEEFNKIPLYFVSKNVPTPHESPSITDTLEKGLAASDLAIQQISLAAAAMEGVNENSLPLELRARVKFAKEKVEEISQTLTATSKYFPAILKLLGDRYPHRYLILFQNNNEIRPTGGFIGSYAILDINDGYIEKLETHDVYDLDGSYHELIEPPEEFYTFTSNWRFRDSNYSPDFTVSAKKARWFLEKEGGPTVDTVIAINQGLLTDLLEITGPIQVGNFGSLNSSNYNLLLSFVIEGKVWGGEDPKHILKVFVPAFKEAIMKEENISSVASKLYKAVQQKHIMMYSSDEDVQALFEAIGISGEVHRSKPDEDYLSVINISTGGTKSEQFIDENIRHDTHVGIDGTLTDEVTISRTHTWSDAVYMRWKKILNDYGFSYLPDDIIDILGRGENKVSTRVYVPDGSVLIDSDGADVVTKYDKDLQKTYFFTTFATPSGETSTIHIKYKLPFKLNLSPAATYKLTIEKQPGSRGSVFTKTVSSDENIENLALFPEDARISSDGTVTYATNLVYDRYFSGVWKK
ncbi:MAG: DUF4012 domain-containing protein [Candidatus Peregrinibacteria bacterium]